MAHASAHERLAIPDTRRRPGPLPHLMRVVWLEAARTNEVYVALILLALYIAGGLLARLVGMDTPHAARFVAGLGLQMGGALAAVLVIVMGARQMPRELELRTIYPVLAKPVTREQTLLGKALPTWFVGVIAMAVFAAATLSVAPGLPFQRGIVLAQAVALKSAELAMLTTLVIWLSLSMPQALTIIVAAGVYFGGGLIGGGAGQLLGDGVPARLIAGLTPDFKVFDQFQRYVDGGAPLSWGLFAALLVFAALWTTVFAGAAVFAFRRRAL